MDTHTHTKRVGLLFYLRFVSCKCQHGKTRYTAALLSPEITAALKDDIRIYLLETLYVLRRDTHTCSRTFYVFLLALQELLKHKPSVLSRYKDRKSIGGNEPECITLQVSSRKRSLEYNIREKLHLNETAPKQPSRYFSASRLLDA